MPGKTTSRKLVTILLAVTIALWAEAGLALVQGNQVMRCSMTMQQMQAMGSMTCCPTSETRVPALSNERPPCCSISQVPEHPLGFVVNSERATSHSLEVFTSLPELCTAPAAPHFGVWRSADVPRFIKPVLELKTDLRI
jgi:hypothetical protein